MRMVTFLFIFYFLQLTYSYALSPPLPPLEAKRNLIAAWLTNKPKKVKSHFHPSFLTKVPVAKLNAVLHAYRKHGKGIKEVKSNPSNMQYVGRFLFITKSGLRFPAMIRIENKAPHRIVGLWFGKFSQKPGPTTQIKAPTDRKKALQTRAKQFSKLFQEQPAGFSSLFHQMFLQKVPPQKMIGLLRRYFRVGGKVVALQKIKARRFQGTYRLVFQKQKQVSMKIVVHSEAPHKIVGLRLGLMSSTNENFEGITSKLKALPGVTTFSVCRLGEKKPTLVQSWNPHKPLAIGSTFKIYILGELLRKITKGTIIWEKTIPLQEKYKSWPSGLLHKWPAGTPLTIGSLAIEMISKSGNTATDHLLMHLGRKKVEAMLASMGNKRKQGNFPFLSTREMFLLKSVGTAKKRLQAYHQGNDAQKRAYLRDVIGKLTRKSFQGLNYTTPNSIDKTEWFASTYELCQAMDWLRKHSKQGKEAFARKVLSVNKGMSWDTKKWRYVGFKGGSETGVANLTWLAQRKDGAWFAVSVGWNNPKKSLQKKVFFRLAQSLVDLLNKKK